MNREQKRKYIKILKSKGMSKSDIDMYLKYTELSEIQVNIPNGSIVKLNVEKIKSHPDYEKLNPRYRNYVDSNIDTVFTVEYEENMNVNNTVYLNQNGERSIWKFWIGDLIIIEEDGALHS